MDDIKPASFGFVCFIECPRSLALDVDRLGAAIASPRSSPRSCDRQQQQADFEPQRVSTMGLGLVHRARASQGFTGAPLRPSTHPSPASSSTRHLGTYIDSRTGNSRYEAPRHWVDQGSDCVPLHGRLSYHVSSSNTSQPCVVQPPPLRCSRAPITPTGQPRRPLSLSLSRSQTCSRSASCCRSTASLFLGS
ncbi:hypothetical protein BC828DRAFT_269190 [Blastocladiella britannica]|nr:hypothetical protein BC828DRAFT_269190 [Blastocladiella britannica]